MRSPKWPQNKKRSRLGIIIGVQIVYLAASVFHFEAILAWTSTFLLDQSYYRVTTPPHHKLLRYRRLGFLRKTKAKKNQFC